MPEIILILARANNGVIGDKGTIPWHCPEDLKRFKELTKGHSIVMGRKTYESLPRLLPGRKHIVLSRNKQLDFFSETVHTVDEVLNLPDEKIYIIGGAEIYDLFLPYASSIELTEIHLAPEGDVRIAYPYQEHWKRVWREEHDGFVFSRFERIYISDEHICGQ